MLNLSMETFLLTVAFCVFVLWLNRERRCSCGSFHVVRIRRWD